MLGRVGMFLRFLSPGMAYLLALLLVFPVSNIPFASAAEPDRPYKIEIFKKCEQGAMGYRVFVEGTELSQKKPKNIRERALRYFGNFMTWPLQSLLLGNLIYTSEELREKNLFVPLPLSEIQDEINTLKNTKAVASYAPANFLGIDLEKKMDFIAPPILVLYLIRA